MDSQHTVEIEELAEEGWRAVPYVFAVAEHLTVHDEDLTPDMVSMATLLSYYGDGASRLKVEAERKDQEAKRLKALVAQEIRTSGVKVTEGGVSERVALDPRVRAAEDDALWSRLKYLRVEAWYYALRRKCDIVISMTYKHGKELERLS